MSVEERENSKMDPKNSKKPKGLFDKLGIGESSGSKKPKINISELKFLSENEIMICLNMNEWDAFLSNNLIVKFSFYIDDVYQQDRSCEIKKPKQNYFNFKFEQEITKSIKVTAIIESDSASIQIDINKIIGKNNHRMERILREKYREKVETLTQIKSKSVYASLFNEVSPMIQRLLGYCRYNLNEEPDDRKILAALNYYMGDNLSNSLYHNGFELTESNFIRRIVNEKSIGNVHNVPLERILDELEAVTSDSSDYLIYEVCYRVIEEIAHPIFAIRQIIEQGQLDRDFLLLQVEQINEAYLRNGFFFKFYEELETEPNEAKKFLIGSVWSVDYPALYREGQIYCGMVGNKKKTQEERGRLENEDF